MEQHDLMTVREVAEALRVSKATVYRMIKDGLLTVIKPGRAYRITRASYQAWLAGQTDEAA